MSPFLNVAGGGQQQNFSNFKCQTIQPWNCVVILLITMVKSSNINLLIIIILPLRCLTQYVNDSSGVTNFQSYYSCYYSKYFNITAEEEIGKRRAFVRGLLDKAVKDNELAPTTACVEWICDLFSKGQ